jgi:general secretion pathway protein F
VALSPVAAQLKRGDGWWGPLRETGMFPDLAVQMIQVGEESGQLPAMLIQLAEILDADVQRTLQRLLSLLIPAMTIFLGFFVATIIAAMLTAILSTYEMPI